MKLVNNALSIGSVLGIPIRLHISLLIVIAFFALFSGLGPLITVILAVGIFGSVALHELGHAVVAKAKGGFIHEIVLSPLGGVAKISNLPTRPVDEALVAAAGPAVSLALMLTLTNFELTYELGMLNGMLFLFNLLPVFPMDGGRILRAALTPKHGRLSATRIAARVGKYFCGFFIWVGLFGLPFQIIGIIGPFERNLMLTFIGFYIYQAGQAEYRMAIIEESQNPYSRATQNHSMDDIEVSKPPYAESNEQESWVETLKNLFRR